MLDEIVSGAFLGLISVMTGFLFRSIGRLGKDVRDVRSAVAAEVNGVRLELREMNGSIRELKTWGGMHAEQDRVTHVDIDRRIDEINERLNRVEDRKA